MNPDRPTEYLLGILSDGESYRRSENTRDREYARADVLRRLGWEIMNIWSFEWYFHKQRVLDAILDRLGEIRRNIPAADEGAPEVDPNFGLREVAPGEEVPDVPADTVSNRAEYVPAGIVMQAMDPDRAVSDPQTVRTIAGPIIEQESPVSETLLVRQYCKAVGIKRLTEQKRSILVPNLRRLFGPETEGDFVTYWNGGGRSFPSYRVSDDPEVNRDIDCVPLVELLNAAEDTVRLNGSLAADKAVFAVARTLGYNRTGAKINEFVEKALRKAVEEGRIKVQNDRYVPSDRTTAGYAGPRCPAGRDVRPSAAAYSLFRTFLTSCLANIRVRAAEIT